MTFTIPEPYERILKLDDDAIAVGDALIINRLDEQIKAALQDYPKKAAKSLLARASRPSKKPSLTCKQHMTLPLLSWRRSGVS